MNCSERTQRQVSEVQFYTNETELPDDEVIIANLKAKKDYIDLRILKADM